MSIKNIKGILINAFYKENNLFVTIKNDLEKKVYLCDFKPYFYISTNSEIETKNLDLLKSKLVCSKITSVEKQNKLFYKLEFENIDALTGARQKILNQEIDFLNLSLFEFDIPFIYRFFIDNNISNFNFVDCDVEDSKIISIKSTDDQLVPVNKLLSCCFDIEVLLNENLSIPKPGKDPVISISYKDSLDCREIFFLITKDDDPKIILNKLKTKFDSKYNVNLFTNELDLIEGFVKLLDTKNPDILYTYNGIFDFEYLVNAYKELTGKELSIGNSRISFTKGQNKRVILDNTLHIDVYVLMRLLNYFQVFNLSKFDLNSLYPKITSNDKLSLPPKNMRYAYLNKEYDKIILYNYDDVDATYILGENYQSFVLELANFLHSPVLDILHSAAANTVEKLFLKYFINNNLIIPNRPSEQQIIHRYQHSFSGAFVKQPVTGLHENLAVVDFRSYHISILITYNISPETVDCDCCDSNEQILDHYICKNKKGFLPKILKNLLDLRIKFKEEMKKHDSNSLEYKSLYAKQYGLKILLASTYGYMGFAGARWYCRSCLEIMYHLVRTKIQELISKFESLGYNVIYGDTDSCFIKFSDIQKLNKDLDLINYNLPKDMHLELENLYRSGIFVMSREKTKAAKKKYALMDFTGNLKIKGFEYVRRDWCKLVKDTQKQVIEKVLSDLDPKSAITLVRNAVSKLQSRDINKEDLVISTFLHKSIKNYKTTNPAIGAVKNAKESGIDFKTGDLIEYIIVDNKGKSISENARIIKLVKDNNYDINYYINNQLIPALSPILDVFKISKDELLTKTKQKGLNDFF